MLIDKLFYTMNSYKDVNESFYSPNTYTQSGSVRKSGLTFLKVGPLFSHTSNNINLRLSLSCSNKETLSLLISLSV